MWIIFHWKLKVCFGVYLEMNSNLNGWNLKEENQRNNEQIWRWDKWMSEWFGDSVWIAADCNWFELKLSINCEHSGSLDPDDTDL